MAEGGTDLTTFMEAGLEGPEDETTDFNILEGPMGNFIEVDDEREEDEDGAVIRNNDIHLSEGGDDDYEALLYAGNSDSEDGSRPAAGTVVDQVHSVAEHAVEEWPVSPQTAESEVLEGGGRGTGRVNIEHFVEIQEQGAISSRGNGVEAPLDFQPPSRPPKNEGSVSDPDSDSDGYNVLAGGRVAYRAVVRDEATKAQTFLSVEQITATAPVRGGDPTDPPQSPDERGGRGGGHRAGTGARTSKEFGGEKEFGTHSDTGRSLSRRVPEAEPQPQSQPQPLPSEVHLQPGLSEEWDPLLPWRARPRPVGSVDLSSIVALLNSLKVT